jgi:hypothetical protein
VRKKSKRSFGRGDRRYGMQVTFAFGGMRSGVGGARHHPTPRFAPRAFLATFALNPLHPSEQTWFARLKDLTSQADMREPRLLDHLVGRAPIP